MATDNVSHALTSARNRTPPPAYRRWAAFIIVGAIEGVVAAVDRDLALELMVPAVLLLALSAWLAIELKAEHRGRVTEVRADGVVIGNDGSFISWDEIITIHCHSTGVFRLSTANRHVWVHLQDFDDRDGAVALLKAGT